MNNGKMSKLMQQSDWSATPVGNPDQWSQTLRTALNVMLSAQSPMVLWWGPEFIQFYNDAYQPRVVDTSKQPIAQGQRGDACGASAWAKIKPLIERAMAGEEVSHSEDPPIQVYRTGLIETVCHTNVYSPIWGEAGQVAGVLQVCQENTWPTARQPPETSEAYLQRIFRAASAGIAIFQGEDCIIEVANPAICALWGRTEADVLGNPLFTALPELTGQGFEKLLADVMRTNKPFVGKEVPATINRNGQLTAGYFDFVYEPLPDADGQVNRILLTASDATEQKKVRQQVEASEANLRSLFEQAPVAIAILRGSDLIYELANKEYLALVDRTALSDLIGKPLLEALPELRNQGIDTLVHEVIRTGKAYTSDERSVELLRNGRLETGYYKFVYEPLRNAESTTDGIFIVAIDVTDQYFARQKADQLLKQERELNDLKSNFLTLASHEFRTPMSMILSSASLIGRYNGLHDDEKRERHVQRIKSAVHSLTGILSDFLSLSHMEKHTMHGRPHPMDIVTFCHELVNDLQGLIKPGQHIVYRHLAGESKINIDGQMLKNILINLLVNASKYSSDGKGIELTTDVQQNQLVVTVRDEGIGIPDADKDKMFITFFRARNATHMQGTGLGLYIVKRYVDLLGGHIAFTSQLNAGTIFTIQLPIYPLPT